MICKGTSGKRLYIFFENGSSENCFFDSKYLADNSIALCIAVGGDSLIRAKKSNRFARGLQLSGFETFSDFCRDLRLDFGLCLFD